MRYRCFRVLNGRKVFGMALALFVLPVAFSSCNTAIDRRGVKVSQGVMFAGNSLGGLEIEEARAVISHAAASVRSEPVDAYVDPQSKGVIPDLNGYGLDVERTLANVMRAKINETVAPVFYEIPADIKLTSFPLLPVYRGNPEKPQVSFLINVAWGNEFLPEMLEALKEADAQATFFLVGRWVRSNSELARAIAEAGFEIANHGDSDALSMGKAGLSQAAADIRKAADTIEQACGVRPVYFSPHRGELTDDVLKAAANENSRVIMWTVDTVDWKLPGVDVMHGKVLSRAEGGSLILMHPTAQTAQLLRRLIPDLRAKGLEPVKLSDLLSPNRPQKELSK